MRFSMHFFEYALGNSFKNKMKQNRNWIDQHGVVRLVGMRSVLHGRRLLLRRARLHDQDGRRRLLVHLGHVRPVCRFHSSVGRMSHCPALHNRHRRSDVCDLRHKTVFSGMQPAG